MNMIQAAKAHSERVASLQADLKHRHLAGFIVPRGDAHQGEYVAPCSERLAWLTGFTGSAGMAVILRDRAALFVDGRYTAQASTQVDVSLFEIRHVTDEPPGDWIEAHLHPRGRIGYDPWLHTPAQLDRYREACKKAGGTLVAVADNPIDTLWSDRPPPPMAPVVAHDERFAGESSAAKRRRVAETLRKDRQDAAVLSAPDSICWLLNIRGGDVPHAPLVLAFAILRSDGSVTLFVDPGKPGPGLGEWLGPDVSVAPPGRLGAALDEAGAANAIVRVDREGTPKWIVERLKKAGAAIAHGADPCELPKAIKSDAELRGIRAAHVRDGASLTRFLAWLSREAPNGTVTELSAVDRLAAFREQNEHYRGPSFATISGSGGNGAIVHYRVTPATDRPLEPGSLYLVDSGGQYLDGTTDVTRTVAIGQPSDEMRTRFTLVLKGHIALATARFPKGTTGSQLDVLARSALWRAGLDYDHGTGHGVGYYLSVHEGPQRISKLPNRAALMPGMVVSNEPGYYKANEYGIRVENLVAVTRIDMPEGTEREFYGFETLTLAPIDRNLVDPGLLSEEERGWLDGYHARVRETLTPLVDPETAAWLDQATQPLPPK